MRIRTYWPDILRVVGLLGLEDEFPLPPGRAGRQCGVCGVALGGGGQYRGGHEK